MTSKEMLINVSEGEECRIALLEDGKLEELYMERASSTSHVGNIYKGRVTNVEASIQAAFVDFGLGRNGFLHISDLMPTYFGRKGEDIQESVGRKMARRDRPPIQRCLRRGDEIIVQIIKEGIGTKGPTLSTYISIPGRILVMMPGMGKFGVSRKIEDEDERRRLRTILDSLKPLKDVGFIIRTAGVGKSKTDIQRDLTYLTRLWQTIEKKRKSGPGPMELYTEGDLVTRTVRDVFTTDISKIVVDSKDVAKRVKEVIKLASPRTKNKVEFYEDPVPLFSKYKIESEIEDMYSRHVPLPSGGSLVIDSTEAVVAIDVNSGKFRDHADAETTAFKTDMEAADEIPRQLRLRDLGGVIICDFIDLRYERHRRELEGRLHENLKNDRAKTKVLRMSQFGIIEMTRQRMRPSLKRSIYFDCPHCHGSGLVKTPESMSLDVMRRLTMAIHDARVQRVELTVCPDVSDYLLNKKRSRLSEMEEETKKSIVVRQDAKLALDDIRLVLFDARDGLVYIHELGMAPPGQMPGPRGPHPHANRGRPGGPPPKGRGGRNRDQRNERQRGRDDEEAPIEDRFELEDDASEPDRTGTLPEREQDTEESESHPVAARKHAVQTPPDEHADDELSQVVEVDEPSEPMGEGPREIEDDRQRNYSRGGQRNRGPRHDNRRGTGRRDNGPRGPGPRGPGPREQGARDHGPREPGPRDEVPRDQGPRDHGPRDQGPRDQRGRDLRPNDQGPRGPVPGDLAPDDQGPRDPVVGDQGPRDQEPGQRRGRRRGRRGRGGRGRNKQGGQFGPDNRGPNQQQVFHGHDDLEEPPLRPQPPPLELDDEDGPQPGNVRGPDDQQPDDRPAADRGDGPKRRRRRRGGRRHRRRNENAANGPAPHAGQPTNGDFSHDDEPLEDRAQRAGPIDDDSDAPRRGAPHRVPPPRGSSPAEPPPVVPRTGSTDSHLMNEDVVDTTLEPEPPRRPRSSRDLDAIPDDFDE